MIDRTNELLKKAMAEKEQKEQQERKYKNYNPLEEYTTMQLCKELQRRKNNNGC